MTVDFTVQCLKVFCYHGNKSTILLFKSMFRRTPEVSSKLYFEISLVSNKLWLPNHRRADFLASKFWILFSMEARSGQNYLINFLLCIFNFMPNVFNFMVERINFMT